MNYLAASERLFPERPGGSGRVAWELLKLMRDRGHRAALVCGSSAVDARPEVTHVEGIEVVRYRYPELRAWDPRRLEAQVRAAAEAVRVLGADGWDVVHGHNLAPALGAFRAVGPGARRLATCHSPALLEQRITWRSQGWVGRLKLVLGEPLLRAAERRLYSLAQGVSVLSTYTATEMDRLYGEDLFAGKSVLIPWWAEPSPGAEPTREAARAALGWPGGTVLYTLRRLVPRMGIDVLLDALEELPTDAAFHVVIAGDGPERGALEERARRGRHAARIRFMGRITDEEAALAYRAADVFILPTRALECFGIIAVEAMARGRPVMAARVAAIPEVVGPILGDWMFEAGDAGSLARLLRRYLRKELTAPGEEVLRAYVEDRYAKAAIGERYARWIEGTLAA